MKSATSFLIAGAALMPVIVFAQSDYAYNGCYTDNSVGLTPHALSFAALNSAQGGTNNWPTNSIATCSAACLAQFPGTNSDWIGMSGSACYCGSTVNPSGSLTIGQKVLDTLCPVVCLGAALTGDTCGGTVGGITSSLYRRKPPNETTSEAGSNTLPLAPAVDGSEVRVSDGKVVITLPVTNPSPVAEEESRLELRDIPTYDIWDDYTLPDDFPEDLFDDEEWVPERPPSHEGDGVDPDDWYDGDSEIYDRAVPARARFMKRLGRRAQKMQAEARACN